MVDAHTRVCGIVGDPIEHSLSPAMHNAAFQALGLNWVYVAFRVTDPATAVAGIRGLGLRGCSVTIPHKLAVIPWLDRLDEVAGWIGSVNTIVNDHGVLLGMNTDGAGAVKALTDGGVELAGKRVLVLGSGGAARAIALTLSGRAGVESIELLGIVAEELERLAADVRERAGVSCAWALLDDPRLEAGIERAELVIHCTPVGMHPRGDETPVPARLWRPGLPVMDIVYNPRETRLLREARAAGCLVVPGFEMLLNQGVLQFEAWTGVPAPIDTMRAALVAGLDKK